MNALAQTVVAEAAARAAPHRPLDFAAAAAEIEAAEAAIVDAIERECAALRAGLLLAAWAFHERLRDTSRRYARAVSAARDMLPHLHYQDLARAWLEERRLAFADLLKVEFAVLAAEQAAAEEIRARALPSRKAPAR